VCNRHPCAFLSAPFHSFSRTMAMNTFRFDVRSLRRPSGAAVRGTRDRVLGHPGDRRRPDRRGAADGPGSERFHASRSVATPSSRRFRASASSLTTSAQHLPRSGRRATPSLVSAAGLGRWRRRGRGTASFNPCFLCSQICRAAHFASLQRNHRRRSWFESDGLSSKVYGGVHVCIWENWCY
jgi:hypothetical protein